MNNPTEDEKKAIANARKAAWERERCAADPAYRERRRERKRERERKLKRDPAYREREQKRERERDRCRKYGLLPGQWDREFDAIHGICPIDGVRMLRVAPVDGSRPHNLAVTDHDHVTNKFRGIICHGCNKNLTKAWCKPQVLRNALAYLKRTGQDPDAPTQGTLL